MLHIFVDPVQMQDDLLHVTGKDVNHIKNVLRLRPGDEISVRTGQDEREYRYGIEQFTDSEVVCRLRFVKESDVELPVKVYLFQGLPKADKMELIIQKSVELGVVEIIPVQMHRSIVKLTGDKRRKRVARWQAIAEAAAKQSKRAVIPRVQEILSMKEALAYAAEHSDLILVPYERMADEPESGTRALIEALQPGQTAAVFVGPEGGFEETEVETAVGEGAKTISLGKRILRTETAALAFLAFLTYRFEL